MTDPETGEICEEPRKSKSKRGSREKKETRFSAEFSLDRVSKAVSAAHADGASGARLTTEILLDALKSRETLIAALQAQLCNAYETIGKSAKEGAKVALMNASLQAESADRQFYLTAIKEVATAFKIPAAALAKHLLPPGTVLDAPAVTGEPHPGQAACLRLRAKIVATTGIEQEAWSCALQTASELAGPEDWQLITSFVLSFGSAETSAPTKDPTAP